MNLDQIGCCYLKSLLLRLQFRWPNLSLSYPNPLSPHSSDSLASTFLTFANLQHLNLNSGCHFWPFGDFLLLLLPQFEYLLAHCFTNLDYSNLVRHRMLKMNCFRCGLDCLVRAIQFCCRAHSWGTCLFYCPYFFLHHCFFKQESLKSYFR